jgi:sn-glycerol 3-phosphate transport system ATP-binding protein
MNVIMIDEKQVGVRPEHVRLVAEGGHQARVEAVEHLGADSIILCDMNGQRILIRQDGFSKVVPREQVRIVWDAVREHRFDPRSGLRFESAREEQSQAIAN